MLCISSTCYLNNYTNSGFFSIDYCTKRIKESNMNRSGKRIIAVFCLVCVFSCYFYRCHAKDTQKQAGETTQVKEIKSQPKKVKDTAYSIPYYTGSIIPVPQKVKYFDKFYNLSNTFILRGKDVAEDDARMKFLIDRVERLGGIVKTGQTMPDGGYDTIICMGDSPESTALLGGKKVPNKTQGYCIYSAKQADTPVIILKAHDKQGLLWAVSSLIQLTLRKDDKPMVRKAKIFDYPIAVKRGFLVRNMTDDWVLFAVIFKFNCIVFHSDKIVGMRKWRQPLPKAWKERVKKVATYMNSLGITWYAGVEPNAHTVPKIQSKSEKDINAMTEFASFIAEQGGGFSLKYDDTRFPMSPADKRDFGSAKKADIYFLSELNKRVKKKHPNFRLLFCPPFYWGPDSKPDYGESREAYLAAIGKLPKNIDFWWTGTKVRSSVVEKSDVKWITDLIKRKPFFWQNALGISHPMNAHYLVEPVHGWKDWHYDGFLDDVAIYALNSNDTLYIAATIAMGDYCWNPRAHDPVKCNEDAVKKLCGVESYSSLVKLSKCLKYFDQYNFTVTPVAAKNITQIIQMVNKTKAAFKEAKKYHPDAFYSWTAIPTLVERPIKLMNDIKDKPDLAKFVKQVDEVVDVACKESAFDIDKDIILNPYDFTGGGSPVKLGKPEKRLATWVYGKKTRFNSMHTGFTIPGTPENDWIMIISAKDDKNDKKCRIKITVNGNTVFEGENPFTNKGWSQHKFTVKQGFLLNDENNVMTIKNLENGNKRSFMLNYVILREER